MRFELRGIGRNTRLVDYVLLAALLVSLVLVAGCNPPPPQYALWNFMWESVDPLYYHIDTQAGENTQLAFSAAVADWNATNTPVDFEACPDNYVVHLREDYIDDEDHPLFLYDGWTIVVENATSTFLHVEASLNAFWIDSGSYSSGARRSVAGHELGHVLGLFEFNGDVLMHGDTGVRFFQNGICTPQQGDIDGVNAMYG